MVRLAWTVYFNIHNILQAVTTQLLSWQRKKDVCSWTRKLSSLLSKLPTKIYQVNVRNWWNKKSCQKSGQNKRNTVTVGYLVFNFILSKKPRYSQLHITKSSSFSHFYLTTKLLNPEKGSSAGGCICMILFKSMSNKNH